MLDSNDPLIALADTINWDIFQDAFAKHYSKEGRPAKPIRLMVGLLILKQLENLSDENIVLQYKITKYQINFSDRSSMHFTIRSKSITYITIRS